MGCLILFSTLYLQQNTKNSHVWYVDRIHLVSKMLFSVYILSPSPTPTTGTCAKFESYPKSEPVKLRCPIFLLSYYYFSSPENFEFSWIYPGEEKFSITTNRFHNHSKEMTSSSWEQFLLLSEIWGEKFHLFFTKPRKWMMSLLYHRNWYYKFYEEMSVVISNPDD